MSFAYPRLLLLLLLIPLLVLLYVMARRARRRKLNKFGKEASVGAMMSGVSNYKPVVKFSLSMAALACIIIAAARPWGGVASTSSKLVGMEVVIAVDASNSMLAPVADNPQEASRMTTAKIMLERLIDNMTNDRVGLVMFAGEAYSLIPASSDFASAKSFLNSITPAEMPVQGTNIEAAIEVARSSFSKKGGVGKAIVLLTDAEELDDSQAAIEAVKKAAKDTIQVNVIGVGSNQPVTIPYENGLLRDENGEVVITKVNEDLGRELAKAGGGVYVNASSSDALPMLQKQMRQAKQSALGVSKYVVHDELYIYFVIMAILLLVAESFIAPGKNRWLSRLSFFSKGRGLVKVNKKKQASAAKLIAFAVISLSLMSSCVSDEYRASRAERESIAEGNKQYADSAFTEATAAYKDALQNQPKSIPASFNKSLSMMREAMSLPVDSVRDKVLKALTLDFDSIARSCGDKQVSAKAFYNAGNIDMLVKDYPGAVDFYKRSLRINPDDSLARRNLRIAQLNLPPKQNGGGGGGGSDQNKDQDQKKDKDKKEDKKQEPQQQQQQPPQQQQQPQQPQQREKANADLILKRAQNKENEVRKKLYQQNRNAQPRDRKNW